MRTAVVNCGADLRPQSAHLRRSSIPRPDLSRIRNNFVIARNTAFTFEGKTVDAKEISKELGGRHVLEDFEPA